MEAVVDMDGANTNWCSREDDVPGFQRHKFGDIRDYVVNGEEHITAVALLHGAALWEGAAALIVFLLLNMGVSK